VRLRFSLLAAVVLLSACATGAATTGEDPLAVGRDVYGRVCSACHGPTGGGGAGPELTGVMETFPACENHVQWVRLGSLRWKDEVGPTYGAPGKEVAGVMPGFEGSLTAGEIAQVAAFERVRYGGADQEATLGECGSG
jgi:mono/diheme cytochrome c family protein